MKAEKGGYYIKSKMGTALDVQSGKIVAGTNVQTYKINESEAQRWLLRGELEGTAKKIEEGTYIIHTVLNDEQVLDVAKGSVDNGANIQIYKNNDTEAQKFRVEAVSDGYYKIISEKSGKALDVKNGSMDLKTNLQQYTWNGSDAQLWRFIDAGDGKVYIQSKLGNVLDVSGGKSSSGTNVQTYVSNKSSAQKWTLKKYEKLYRIMGKTDTTVAQMAKFYKARAKVSYPYADTEVSTIEDFCKIYIEECNAEGVKAEVAFCQSMLETGFLKFGGDVKPEQYNFAGLGSEAAGISGNSFPDIRTGIRTQVQHLKAYASTEPLKNECVDGRFKYVKRGSAEFVEWLGIPDNPNNVGWATGENYGYNIVKLYIAPLKNTK